MSRDAMPFSLADTLPDGQHAASPFSLRAVLNRAAASRAGFALPGFVLAALGGDIRRVVLVANNPHLTQADFDHVQPSDLVVHFNKAMHFGPLLKRSDYHLVFFRAFDDAKTKQRHHFGPEFRASFERKHSLGSAQVGFIFAKFLPEDSGPRNVVKCVVAEPHPLLEDYPRLDVWGSGPSTGFFIYRLFERLQRSHWLDLSKPKFAIATLGFADIPEGYFWEGHNWPFERAYLRGREVR